MNQLFINPTEKKEIYNLSSAQKRLFFIQHADPSNIAYNLTEILPLDLEDNIEEIESIFKKIIQRHEILRTSFHIIEGVPCQKIHGNSEIKIEIYEEDDLNINRIVNKYVKPFDLSTLPLIRVNYIKSNKLAPILLIDFHHIIFDATSTFLFYQEFDKIKNNQKLRKLKIQYKDYSEWQIKRINLPIIEKQREFWRNKFKQDYPKLNLPIDFKRPKIKSYEGAARRFVVGGNRASALNAMSQAFDMSLFTIVFTLFKIFLLKLSNQNDIIVGVPIRGRNDSVLLDMMGMFVNTLPLRFSIDSNKTFLEVLHEAKENVLLALENQDYQFDDLINDLTIDRDTSREPLFDVMFDFLNQQEYEIDIDNDESIKNNKEIASQFDLTLKVIDLRDDLYVIFEYCTNLFREETIIRFIDYFIKIVDSVKENINIKIQNIDVLPEEEKKKLLHKFNDTEIDYPREKSICQLFEEKRVQNPLKIAVCCDGESINYKELSEKSGRLANYIFNLVGQNSIVGIMANRSIEMIIGILAILKSGNAYLPLDIRHPLVRNHKILKESDATIVLSDNKDLHFDDVKVVNILNSIVYVNDEISEFKNTTSTNPAYVIYTSGSTGVPKGVLVTHRSVVNLVNGIQGLIPTNNSGTILSLTTISFDIFGLELYTPLLNGFSLVLAKDEDLHSTEKIAKIVKEQSVNILQLTPSRLGLMLADEYSKGIFDVIEVLLVGGEELPATLLSNLRALFKGKIYNMYGPTETTIWSTFKDVSGDLPLNIGKPINNTQVYILGLQNEISPIGVPGELSISGDGLALGYLNNSELTREKFIENPYKSGKLLYKTGDLARWLPNGNIEFLGRIDQQVKIRGYRIELGEIESALLKLNEIEKAVVIDNTGKSGEKYLCAYIIFNDKITSEEIRSYLSGLLPDYMIPSYFVEIGELPLTSNGKLNRKNLPLPDIGVGDNYVAASNPLEEQLVKIWEEVLNIHPIGVTDNFYKIGGNSLLAITLLSKIEKKLGERIQFSTFLQNLTIKELSIFIYQLFSWSANFHLDESVIKEKNIISSVRIANLQTKGENLPIFFVAPLGGILPATSIVGIMDLPLLLGEEQPFYSVQVPPLFSDLAQSIYTVGELNLSGYNFTKDVIQQFVNECIQSIQNIYKGKELYIGGFCTGCIFSMELAAQIEKSGFKVKEVFLIDPPLKENFSDDSMSKECSQISGLDFNKEDLAWFVAKDIGGKQNINLNDVIYKLENANNEEIWDVGTNILISHKTVAETTTPQDLKISFYQKFYNQELITAYLSGINYKYPKIEAEKTSLIIAGMDEVVNNKGFVDIVSKYFKNTVAIENVSGDHGSVFQQPNINQLVEIIKRNVHLGLN